MIAVPEFLQSPRIEWTLIVLLASIAVVIIHMRVRAMFQNIQDQITRLASVISNLSAHIDAITVERNDLRLQVTALREQVDKLDNGLPEIEIALREQVDRVVALFPEER